MIASARNFDSKKRITTREKPNFESKMRFEM